MTSGKTMGGMAAAFAVLASALSGPAHPASITNRDAKDVNVTLVEKDARQDHLMKPSAVIDGVCLKGCVVRLDDSPNNEYILEGAEAVSIEDGNLFHDGDAGTVPVKPAGEAPPAKQP